MGPPMAFPHYLGPGTRQLTSVLLYEGRIDVCLPGWGGSEPVECFYRVHDRATELSHPLTAVLRNVLHFFLLSQKQSLREVEALKPLDGRIRKILTLYPGTEAAYAGWEPLHEACLPLAQLALNDVLTNCTASVEFVWRVWELALELGATPDQPTSVDVDGVLARLTTRAAVLGKPERLLAECVLNRYCMPRSGCGSYATTSDRAIELLAAVGNELREEVEGPDPLVVRESLAFYLFDRVVEPFVRPISARSAPVISELLVAHAESLARMRKYCEVASEKLMAAPPSHAGFKSAVADTLKGMTEEASAFAEIDSATTKSYFTALAENDKVWLAVAGLLGSAVALPGVVAASLALTGFALLGAQAVKSSNERRQKLRRSPWTFLYHAQTAFKRRQYRNEVGQRS